MENINIHIRRIKWKWAGHLARIKDERCIKTITEWQAIDKKRKNVIQPKRWSDDFAEVVGRDRIRVARQRTAWRHLGVVYTPRGLIPSNTM